MSSYRPSKKVLESGYRSGLEIVLAKQLDEQDISYRYEEDKIKFVQPATNRTYTPDFFLPNGVIIEAKGRFTAADRKKHMWVRQQHPELDIRFVFSNSKTKLRTNSPTTYGDWCHKNGFKYADKKIPEEWINE